MKSFTDDFVHDLNTSFMKYPGSKWNNGVAAEVARVIKQSGGLSDAGRYREPFCGTAGVFFTIAPQFRPATVLSDTATPLVTVLTVIRDAPDSLMSCLDSLESDYMAGDEAARERLYYATRGAYNLKRGNVADPQVAAMVIFLANTAFNGLWRVNSAGYHNAPFGRYPKPAIMRLKAIVNAHWLLEQNVEIFESDFVDALAGVGESDFVYLDPPYLDNFTGYTRAGFGAARHALLADWCRELDARGVRWVQSNSDLPEARRLYDGFFMKQIPVRRSIAAVTSARQATNELLISNVPALIG